MQTTLKDIGARIREARVAAGINQAELAEKLNLSPTHMSDIENGPSKFGVDILVRLTEVLQVSADALLRTNVPTVNAIYAAEFEEIVDGCSTAEREAMLNTLKNMKAAFRAEK